MKTSNSYLPFRDCHIVEIDGISPEQLKLSAKKIKKDKERPKVIVYQKNGSKSTRLLELKLVMVAAT